MSTINIFQISLEIWGCIISSILCILLGTISFTANDIAGKTLWRMILINNLLLVSDALAYLYRGDLTPLGVTMTRSCNFSLFALEYILLGMFVYYVTCITSSQKAYIAMRWKYLAYGLLIIGFAGLFLTQMTGLYYSFDETNHYQRESGIWISFAVCVAVVILCFIRLFVHRNSFEKSEKATFFLCMMIFFVCMVVQFLCYGLSLINIGLTVVLLLIYLRHYKTQYDRYIQNKIEEAILDAETLVVWKSDATFASDSASGSTQRQTGEGQYEKHQV